MTMDAELGGSHVLGLQLRGCLAVSTVDRLRTGLVRVRLDEAHLEQTGKRNSETTASLHAVEPQLGDMIDCELGKHGEIRQVWLPPNIDPLASRLIRTLLVHSQVVTSDDGLGRKAWESEESDLTGNFRIAYAWDSTTGTLAKAKQSLIRVHPGAGLGIRANDVKVVRSSGRFHVDENGTITELDYTEEQAFSLVSSGPQSIDAKSTTQFSLKNGRPDSDGALMLAATAAPRTAQSPYEETTPRARSSATDLARVGGMQLSDILGDLRMLDRESSDGKQGLARLHVAASALFRLHPEAVLQARAIIQKNRDAAAFLIGALGDAGTEKSAEALTDLLKSSGDADMTRELLGALGRTAHPSPASLAAVQSLYTDAQVGGFARLMSGAMAYSARESTPAVGAAAVDGLIQTLKAESSSVYVADDLRALGNSGDSKAGEVAAEYAKSEDAMIRAAAAQSARKANTPRAVETLIQLISDREPSVRTSALTAALYTQPSPYLVSAVEGAAKLDSQESVRRDAVRVLVKWQLKEPAVRTTLAWVSANDANDKIRAVAREGLMRFD